MQDRVRRIIGELEREFPAYMIWHVPIVVGADHWNGKRHDGTGQAMVCDSPEQLQQAIEDDIDERARFGGQAVNPAQGWLS